MILMMPFHTVGGEDAAVRLESLLMRMAGGDRSALETLYRETSAAVYGLALSVTKNAADAEDVLQETYLNAWNAAESYRSRGTPMAWLLTIAKNLARMKLRQGSRAVSLDAEEWALLPASAVASPEDRLLLETALRRLAEEERQIVMLHAVAGLKHREIASLLDLALPTVLSKYHRALKKLRTYMEGEDAR